MRTTFLPLRKMACSLALHFKIAVLLLVATAPAWGQSILGGCLYSLDPGAQQAFFITGNTTISAGCSIVVESSSSSAFVIGGTETLNLGNHAKVGVVGGWQLNGNAIVDTISSQQEQPVTIATPGDPLASVVAPTTGTIVSASPVIYSQSNPPPNNTLLPGVYCGGVAIGDPGGAKYTMAPGTYIMAGGGFKLTSSADVVGSGVTIYNTSSGGWGCSASYSYVPVDIDGQAELHLSAPTSGSLAGIVFFGDRNGCATPGSCIDNINGQATATFTGNLYFPSDQLIFNGSSTTGGCMGVVADTITINGHSNFGSQACSINPITIAVTPATTALYGGQQQSFSAAVTNTYNTAVTWSISPSAGSIDASGTYTAPATISTQQTVTVTATSQANPNVSASATITLFPPVTVAVSPATALLYQGQPKQFSATVGNAINTAVTWAISPAGAGTVDGNGFYTAPAMISSQQTVIVTATSVVDTSKSASATITLMPPIAVSLSPVSATLYGGQPQQFIPMVVNTSNTAVTWSLSPTGVGSLDGNGNYTAPAAISTQQSVTVTATSVADPTKSASATITLMPPIAVSVSPATITLNGGQTEQFNASVLNTANSAVTWSISPAETGTISASGLYTAPATISSQQTVTITATSQADPTKSASATITLAPPACTASGYSYVRAIVIDHTKVPNTDQVNIPFLFETTDPLFATTGIGGHVTSIKGYDIAFSSDPSGSHLLNYEMEEYNSATGQVIAWVNLPTLSHSSDTVIYILYGNPAITTSQQSPTKVWDANYKGVWHLPNGSVLSLADSTSNGNNATSIGATAAAGQIDGGMQTNGNSYAIIGTPASLANLAQGNATFSAWVKPASTGGSVLMGKDNFTSGWVLDLTYNNKVDFRSNYSFGDLDVQSSSSLSVGVWSHIVVTLSGSPSQGGTATIYINGVPSGSRTGGVGTAGDDSAQNAYLANATYGSEGWTTLNGIADEFRISNVVRSSDWIATEYNSQSSPATFYHLSTENVAVSPTSTTLYGTQTQQFTATVLNGCTNSVSWTLEPAGLGTISASGLYTAPSTIETPQTVTVTATSQANPTKSASVTVNLLPPIAVAVSPANTTLSDGGQQKFTANVSNSSNTAVTWSVSPAGAGTIDANGLYSAPSGFSAQQTVTVTATSEADITKSASATITLIPPTLPPPVCASNVYSFVRAIVIDHTQVQNTDQTNFPFLFDSTDPTFAATVNGGHIANFNADDLIFSTDPEGKNPLNYDLEEYNPVTGQIVAWIQIPDLSHTTDTVLYMLYGNTAVASSQQDPAKVWDANYKAVWHVGNRSGLSLADSTGNANNATNNGAIAAPGQIDGGMSTDGTTYATVGAPADLANLAQGNATFSAWVNLSAAGDGGAILGNEDSNFSSGWLLSTYYRSNYSPGQFGISFEGLYSDSYLEANTTASIAGGTWSYVVVTLTGTPTQGEQATIYINGVPSVTTSGGAGTIDDSGQAVYLGNVGWQWPLSGISDELRISNTVRSADWIATEFNNQSSPTTFYQVYPENLQGALPSNVTLNASQSEQFTVLSACAATAVTWSMPSGSPGTLTPEGFYTSPSSIATQQSITLTATNNADGSVAGTATVSLLPPISISITPATTTLQAGQSQQFTAVVSNTSNTKVRWTTSSSDFGSISSTGTYTAPGDIRSLETVTVTATSIADPNVSASATITLDPVTVDVTPPTAVLFANQTQPFETDVYYPGGGCFGNTCTTWSISPPDVGTIDSSGLYKAPASISTAETATIIATALEDGITGSASASVTLIPNAPTIAIEPATTTLMGGQKEQYIATVTNSSNTGVTWSMSPTGLGTLSPTGLYLAPPVVTSRQVITITAVSQTDPSLTATATLTLSPAQCAAAAYKYERPIVIDHTKIPNTDQPNFPFFFAVTDPSLASIANGGHVTSSSGYDIQFSTDPAGQHTLDYELEQYNPVTGQITAWIGLPNLSHTSDTVIYMFYGNPDITEPQQKPGAVWDSNYTAIYQFDKLEPGILADITSNGNNGWNTAAQQTTGVPGGAASFDGSTSFLSIPPVDFASFPASGVSAPIFNSSFGIWFKTSSSGVILGQVAGTSPGGDPSGWIPALYIDTAGKLRASFFNLTNAQQIVSATTYNDNHWHHAMLTFDTNTTTNTLGLYGAIYSATSGVETLYVDGQTVGTRTGAIPDGYTSSYHYSLGTGYAKNWGATNSSWFYFNGSLGQVEISSIPRSSDWVRDEYLNQSSPATFFQLGPEAGANPGIDPLSVVLYGSQNQQFAVLAPGTCNAGEAIWSMPAGSLGTLSSEGLYTAPSTIAQQQAITLTARTLGASSAPLNATVTLMPPVGISVAPGMVQLPAGGMQQFTATVSNASNSAVTWTLAPAGVGSISATGIYTAPATLTGQTTVSVIATSLADSTRSASATITLGAVAPMIPAVNVIPGATTLYPSQTQQFTATVTNADSAGVTWSISPTGVGSIDANGMYTAPSGISSQETVTITATSVAYPTQAASATAVLMPLACGASAYSYSRAIVIDHTQVPNTDQANFPFLFDTTDPLFATTANGGHLTSADGDDIMFSMDPSGQTKLDYEIEQYNPVTGQIIAWIRVPDLSHTTDTTIYMFYGNSSVTTSQQNPTGVWESSFKAVYHMESTSSGVGVTDSTANANSGISGNDGITLPSVTTGVFGAGAGSFNGSQGIYLPSMSIGAFTLSAWIYPTTSGHSGAFFAGPTGAMEARIRADNVLNLLAENKVDMGSSLAPLTINAWHHVVISYDGTNASYYIDGLPSGTSTNSQSFSSGNYFIGEAGNGEDFIGNIGEVHLSTTVRSADWIAAEYNNQSSPSRFYKVSLENNTVITPASVTLYASESQQFAAFSAPAACGAGVTWSLSSGAPGILEPNGNYIAPETVSTEQTVVVTATSQATPSQTATATVTLMPPVSMSVTPASATLSENQTQRFTATVNNSSDQTVTWSISPANAGSIDQTGAYTAPSSIATQQTVTITATSETDTTKTASAMVTLAPSQCASTGYGYQRVIVIDHTKVANTDQINFPFLFNTTDHDLATVDNGGHVANSNGYDIIFSADPNGRTRLDFEVEKYNPVTGQLVAWIRVPTLSHSSDTVIYVFYGNPAITISQANPAGVWDSNFQAVYHLGNLPSGIATDSTSNANNGSVSSITANPGQIDGSASLDGSASFLEIPSTAFPSYPTGVYSNIGVNTTWHNTTFSATYGVWFRTNSWGGLLDLTAGYTCGPFCLFPSPEQPGEEPDGSWGGLLDINFNGNLGGLGVGPSTQAYNDNNWHYAAITVANGVSHLYADGHLIGTGQGSAIGFSPNYAFFVGAEDVETDNSSLDSQPWKYLGGQVDEISVSSIARSGDWIQTQYNNQSSPSTFYSFFAPSAIQVAPSLVSLYAAQSEQFTVAGTCNSTIQWSLPASSAGTLTATGLYTAPAVIPSQQTVTVSATRQSNGSSLGSAVVTLLPPPQPLTLVAASAPPYRVGTSQSFTATLLNPEGNPRVGVTINFTVAGVNGTTGSATTDLNGAAVFAYTGSNSGTDSVQAVASVDNMLVSSNTITATWLTPPPLQVPTVTLLSQPSPGRGALMGAFTDGSGNLIEPIVVGSATRTFITPAGATQLQLGINDNYYEDNGGVGFVVSVNGLKFTVPPTAVPWKYKAGGLNNNYQFGIGDGTSPVVAAAGLAAGESVTVAYQNGTVSTDNPLRPLVNADGESDFITGTQLWQGTYFPTMYTTDTSYPQGQPISVFAMVTDATGAPIPNAAVTLSVAGANPGQYQAISDVNGTASFLYTGQYAGNDSLQVQAVPAGLGTLTSNQTETTWTNYPVPPPVGSLSLNYILSVVNAQSFSSFARDASGSALSNVNVGFYITGVDNFQTSSNTNNIGEASFRYYHTQSGNYSVIAVDSVGRNVIVTRPYTGNWVVPTGTPSGSGGTISINISANTYVTLPNTLQLNGTVTDSNGVTPAVTWTEVSGPGTVTFATPNQAITTASFSQAGTYVLQLFATDSVNSGWAQFTVNVEQASVASVSQGWIGTPSYGTAVSGVVPITLAAGVSLASGTLSYTPTNNPNPNDATIINGNVSGTGQIGTLDTTLLPNGSYWIQLQGTDTTGQQEYSLVLVTVTGGFKPGRVTATVTDLTVPSTGLPINIQRTYDSLNANTIGDFGYGWNLGINVNLSVGPSGDVTFTLNGQRKTFHFAPQPLGFPFAVYEASFTPEPGLFGKLTDSEQGCPLDLLYPDGSSWQCTDGAQYNPPGYIYTDPTGTSYTISAGGALQSVVDKNGNALTITPNGITSSTGLNVPFVRDSQGRITQITDPQGNNYLYTYDVNGNLATVTYPGQALPSTYTYAANHYYTGGTDARGNALPDMTYYGPTDPDGLNGRLESVTDAAGETTSYAYDLDTNTTTITYPPDASGATGTATMVYDSAGDLIASTDPLGHTTRNVYDSHRNLTSVTDPMGNVTSYTYDTSGNQTSVTYPKTGSSSNTTSSTAYNQYGEPISTKDELGNVRTFNYDTNYNPSSVTDSVGTLASFLFNSNGTLEAGAIGYDITGNPASASQFAYDANGDLVRRTDALGRTTSYSYNSLGQKVSMTIPVPSGSSASAATTTYTYNAFGNLTQTAAPLGRTTSSTYDANGNKLSDTDARGHVTHYQYDALNRLIKTTYPDSTTDTRTYDFRNNLVDEVDQAGHDAHYNYDLAGHLASVTKAYGTPDASTTTYTYDADGRKLTETDALNHTTTYTYDAAGNLTGISGPGGTFTYGYDNARNRVSMTDGNGHTTTYAYDARKRLVKTTYPDGTFTTDTYDGPGNLASVTDQAGNVVKYTYDAANQLKSVVQVNSPNTSNNTTSYGYDPDGDLITLTDANGHATSNSYDLLYELRTKTLPDGSNTETRTYDPAGNLLSLKHFNGDTTSYAYDDFNRLLTQTPDATTGEPAVSFTYTPTGKRASMTDASGITNYTYDNLDRLITKQTPEGTLNYTYDAAGNLASMTSGDGNVSVNYTWDSLNRLSTVTDNRLTGTSNTTTYTYDTASNVVQVAYPNGVQATLNYDTLNRLTSLTTPNTGYLYQLGPTGTRTNVTELTGRSTTWSYDGIYRLTGETISNAPSKVNGSVTYGLDPVGNRLSTTSTITGINSGALSFNPDDQTLIESYDADGNTTATGGKNFAYDSEDRLKSMNGGAVTITYDGDGNRVEKIANGVVTKYLVDDLNPTGYAQVVEETGLSTRTYTYGLQRIDENQVINGAQTPSFYGYDGMGNVRQLTNSSGAITDTYEYDAFGNLLNKTGTTPNNYLYRGEQWDPDLGLYYLRARYMNPLTGRFMSRDPGNRKRFDPKSLHKYLYANGDPVNLKDPTGQASVLEFLLLAHFAVQRTLTVAVPTSIAICEAYDYLDLGVEAYENANTAITGEYDFENGPSDYDHFKDFADHFCHELLPEP